MLDNTFYQYKKNIDGIYYLRINNENINYF